MSKLHSLSRQLRRITSSSARPTKQQLLAAYKNQQREIARLQDFADRFRAKATKASQAQSKLKQIDRMEKIEAPASDDKKVEFLLPATAAQRPARDHAEDIHFAYGAERGLSRD